MLHKTFVALLAVASIGLVSPTMALARGGEGGAKTVPGRLKAGAQTQCRQNRFCASSRCRWSMRDTIAARKSALAAQFFTSSLTTSLTCRRTSASYFAGRARGHNA